jgi:hypothetical protein
MEKLSENEKLIIKIYYTDPRIGLSTGQALFKEITRRNPSITYSEIRRTLAKIREIQINKRKIKKKFLRITAPPSYYQADLMIFEQYKHQKRKRGYIGLLNVIEIATRKGYIHPIKNKMATTMREAFKEIFKRIGFLPKFITSDAGSEFKNRLIIEFFTSLKVGYSFASTADKEKMGMIERFNRTIRQKFEKLMLIKYNHVWFDYWEDIEYNYNIDTTHHNTIRRLKPAEMTRKDSLEKGKKDEDEEEYYFF